VHDTFRLSGGGVLVARLKTISGHRRDLVGKQLGLGDTKARKAEELALAKDRVENAQAAIKEDATDQGAMNDLETANDDVARLDRELEQIELRLALIASTIKAIDDFTSSLTAVPEGGSRSPLTLAALRAGLRPPAPGAVAEGRQQSSATAIPEHFTHVLLVKGNAGSTSQVIDDRAFWVADRFAVVGTAGITYMMIETATNAVLAAGEISGGATASGKIAGAFKNVRVRPVKLSQ